MTRNEIITAATVKGWEITEQENAIAFRFPKSFVWHWFTAYDDGECFFNHSYSMNTGKSKSGCSQMLKVNGWVLDALEA